MKAVIEISSYNGDGDQEAPCFFVLEVTDETLDKMELLQSMCSSEIIRVVANSSRGLWESEEREAELLTYGDKLNVNNLGEVWFQTYQKFVDDCRIRTIAVSCKQLRDDFEAGKALAFYSLDSSLECMYKLITE